jgi:hypothetical protein
MLGSVGFLLVGKLMVLNELLVIGYYFGVMT